MWFYISLATEEKFVGGLHVQADDEHKARAHAEALDIEVPDDAEAMMVELPPGMVPGAKWVDCLLTKEQIEECVAEMMLSTDLDQPVEIIVCDHSLGPCKGH